MHDLLEGGVVLAHGNVVENGAWEQRRALLYHSNVLTQPLEIEAGGDVSGPRSFPCRTRTFSCLCRP